MARRPTALRVIMYHYVRDLPNSPFPRLKGMLIDEFRRQVGYLADRFEMCTLEAALHFLRGSYRPQRDLCLLTFDDGLLEHYAEVTPILCQCKIPGLFFVIGSCTEERQVAPVHKNHFLLALLGTREYRQAFQRSLAKMGVEHAVGPASADTIRQTYRWDDPETAAFKYMLNFGLPAPLRNQVVDQLFTEYLGADRDFAADLYLTWQQCQEMQAAGMVLGGHSFGHQPLAKLSQSEQRRDLERCARLLHERLNHQNLWPFSYPFGKPDTFDTVTVDTIQRVGFHCAFVTQVTTATVGQDVFRIPRIDPKDAGEG